MEFPIFSENAHGETAVYVNAPVTNDVHSAMDTEYLQVGHFGQASDDTPYANESALGLETTSAKNAVPHQEKPGVSPYENVRGPGEYEMLGHRSPQLPAVYDSIK